MVEDQTADLRSAYASGRRRIGPIRAGVAAAIAAYAIAYRPLPGYPEGDGALPTVLSVAGLLALAGLLRYALGSRVGSHGEAAFLLVDVLVVLVVNAAYFSDPRHELWGLALLVLAETAVVLGLRTGVAVWAVFLGTLLLGEETGLMDHAIWPWSLGSLLLIGLTGLLVTLIAGLLARELSGERRRRVDDRARELERIEGLVHGLDAIVWEATPDARFTFVSRHAEALLGYPCERWLADPGFWAGLVHPEDREEAVATDRTETAGGRDHQMEYRAVAADGSVRWLRDIVRVVKDETGRPSSLQGIMVDVTDRHDADARLRETEVRYRSLVEQLPGAMYVEVVEEDGADFLYMSPQIERLIGFPASRWDDPEFWVGRVHPEDIDRILAEDERTNATGEPFQVEYRQTTADGRLVWLRDHAALVEGEPGGRMVWLGFALDITKEKEAEAEVRASIEALRSADHERRRLLARLVSAQEEERRRIAGDIHDDPVQKMTAAGLRLQALRRRLTDPEDVVAVDQAGAVVTGAIERLRRLLFELRPPALDRDGLASALHQYLSQGSDEAAYDFAIVNRLVTEPTSESRATAYRIAQEALANVRKHAKAARVEVTLEEREGGLFVRIRDDGVGFELAPRQDSPDGHLGISSMRERAELAGGWWRIESRPAAGTTVEFWLPGGRHGLRAAG